MSIVLTRGACVGVVCIGLAACAAVKTAGEQDAPKGGYFDGRLLTADELQREQTYHSGEGRAAPGFGQISGLAVAVDGGAITIAPGTAVAPDGEKVVLQNVLRLETPAADGKRYAVVCATLRDQKRRCLLLAVVERTGGRVRVERAGPG